MAGGGAGRRIPLTPWRPPAPGGVDAGGAASDAGRDAPGVEAATCATYDQLATAVAADGTLPAGLAVLVGQLGGARGLHGDYPVGLLDGLPRESVELTMGFADALRVARPSRGMSVLDVGCGSGVDALLARGMVGETGYVAGVDLSGAMVERARIASRQLQDRRPEFRVGRAAELPWPDSTFDRVVMNCALSLFPDRPAALREAARVTASGGGLAIADVLVDGLDAGLRCALSGWGSGISAAPDLATLRRELEGAGWAVRTLEVEALDRSTLDALAARVAPELEPSRRKRLLAPVIEGLSGRLARVTVFAGLAQSGRAGHHRGPCPAGV